MAKSTLLTADNLSKILDRKFDEKLAPLATTKDVERIVDVKLTDYVTKSNLKDTLSAYPTTEKVQLMFNEAVEKILKQIQVSTEDRSMFRGLQKKVHDLENIHPNNTHKVPPQFAV